MSQPDKVKSFRGDKPLSLQMMPLRLQTSVKGRLPDERIIYHAVESQHWANDFPFRVPGTYFQAFCGARPLWWQETKRLPDVPERQICKHCLRFVWKVKQEQERMEKRL